MMVSTKPNRLKPDGTLMITSKLAVTDGQAQVPTLGSRQVSSPGLLLRRDSTRIGAAHRPLAENKRRHTAYFAQTPAVRSAQLQRRVPEIPIEPVKTAPEGRDHIRLPIDPSMTRTTTSIVDIRKNRWIGDGLRTGLGGGATHEDRLFRNIVSLDKLDNAGRHYHKDSSLDIYRKIKRDRSHDNKLVVHHEENKGIQHRSADNIETKENKPEEHVLETAVYPIAEENDPYVETPMHTRRLKSRKGSPIRTLPHHLPSLTLNDENNDITYNYDGPYNFDNPRYSIPAARGRHKQPSSAVEGHKQQQKQPEQGQVESIPMTIMDIAQASPKIRQSKHGEWLFNTDEDIRKFRQLLQDSPPKTICRNLDNLSHTNYCDKEKTKWIMAWIQDVDETQAREGKWSDPSALGRDNGESQIR